MPSGAFKDSLAFVLQWEGGYVDHPADPGGRTNRGITQKTYDSWRGRRNLPPRDVRLIEESAVNAIYADDYWVPPRCDQLRRQLDLVQFDTAVNMGVRRAVRFLQAACVCTVDGAFGPVTEKAAAECDLATAIDAYCDARGAYYHRLVERNPDLGIFLKGWNNRLNALRNAVSSRALEAATFVDFGDVGYIGKIPDSGEDPSYDF